jgi:hypothetical protein
MKSKNTFLLLLVFVSGSLFFVSNHYLRGYLRSEVTLAREIKTPLDSISQYRIASEAPFKYRILFPGIIKGSYFLTSGEKDEHRFFLTYTIWSLIFYASSVSAFYWLLLSCGFSPKTSFAGSCLFLLLPSMLLAFTLPVHTREDTLAYTLLFTGLVFLIRDQWIPFVLVSLLGVLCRETLLILPLVYFFYARDAARMKRVITLALPLLLWVSLRAFLGPDEYDVWLGLRWNLANMEQVIGFLFISFNFCWLPFIMGLVTGSPNPTKEIFAIGFFRRSAWFVGAVIVFTTFVGGIYNEIRLLHLLSPWVIIITIDFIGKRKSWIISIIKKTWYRFFFLGCAIFCGIILFIFLHYQERIIIPGKFAVPYHLWIISSVCYIFILLLFLPITLYPFERKSDQ